MTRARVLLLAALVLASPLARAGGNKAFTASALRVDALRLGAPIGPFEEKYKRTLCDADPIDGKSREVWFHAPKPCREADPLPGGTIVVLYTKSREPTDPIEAIAWFGNWPHAAGTFPLDTGIKVTSAEAQLGAGKKLFDFAGVVDGGDKIVVARHAPAVYSIARDGVVIGYVVGAMSDDREREEWRGLVANVLRYMRSARSE